MHDEWAVRQRQEMILYTPESLFRESQPHQRTLQYIRLLPALYYLDVGVPPMMHIIKHLYSTRRFIIIATDLRAFYLGLLARVGAQITM